MSKSLGNVVAPEKVIKQYGAEILRLWVSASDYRDDVRISEKILKQLTDAYRRIRNTSRFMLGNLSDFDPGKHQVDYDKLLPIDRYALHNLQDLIARTRQAYDRFEFHTIYHALFNYCTLDLSAFYLDILKDRLYTSPTDALARRSAQSALYQIADAMARLMAPIMVFTAEEIWRHLPGQDQRADSIHLATLPEAEEGLRDDTLATQWSTIKTVRAEVTKALETARTQKVIGHSLDAAVTVGLDDALYAQLLPYKADLNAIFIVSKADLHQGLIEGGYQSAEVQGVSVQVASAAGDKCERCWVHDPSVGQQAGHVTICERCYHSLEVMGQLE